MLSGRQDGRNAPYLHPRLQAHWIEGPPTSREPVHLTLLTPYATRRYIDGELHGETPRAEAP